MAIRQPFGNSPDPVLQALNTVTKCATAAAIKVSRTITENYSRLRIATGTKEVKINLAADDNLPAGAIVLLNVQTAGSRITLGTGIANMRTYLNTITAAANGTGNYFVTLMYDGTNFVPTGRPYVKGNAKAFFN